MNSLSDLSMSKLSVVSRSLLVCFLTSVAFTGCGGSGPKLVPVKGKVTLDGTDLKAGQITFVPDKAKGNNLTVGAAGKIVDGAYTLTSGGKDGAPLGWYKVTVSTDMPGGMGTVTPGDPSKPASLTPMGGGVNKSFTSPETTSLSVEVVATPDAGKYDFKVTK